MWSLLSIRKEDRKNLAMGFIILMVLMIAHTILETARDSLFLASLPATDLPWAYLAIAALATAALHIQRRLLPIVRDRHRLLSLSLLGGSLVTLGFWFFIGIFGSWSLIAFYVWTALLVTVVVVQFWLLLGDCITVTQAKRIFPPIAAGGAVGAILGALAAEALLSAIEPRGLLVAAAVVLAGGAAMLWLVDGPPLRAQESDATDTEEQFSIRSLMRDRYLARLLLLVLASTVTVTAVDYIFKSAVANHIAADSLGTFFARFYFGLNSAALVVQLFVAGWMLRTFGVHRSAGSLPLLILAGALGMVFGPVLVGALAVKAVDGALRHSLHRTAVEMLYLPLGRARRERTKTLIDGFGHRGGQAFASLLILGAVVLGFSTTAIAVALLVPIALWLLAIAATQRLYADLFRTRLRQGVLDTRLEIEELDLHSLEALLSSLSSDRDEEVLAAIDIFDSHGKAGLLPVLILYHPSTQVRVRALKAFAEAEDSRILQIAHRMLEDEDCEIRASALRAITAIQPDRQLLVERLDGEAPIVEATALIGLLSLHSNETDEARLRRDLDARVRQGSIETRVALARAIHRHGGEIFQDTLLDLAKAEAEPVKLETARAMAANPSNRYLPCLVSWLANGKVRPTAREALLALGKDALQYLDAAMDDPDLPRTVRRHLPRTISRFHHFEASDILLKHLQRQKDSAVRFKILRGLGRLRADHPRMPLDDEVLEQQLRQGLIRTIQFIYWRLSFEDESSSKTQIGQLLCDALAEKETATLERAFRILGILHPKEDLGLVWRGLQNDDPRFRAASRELLEATLPSGVRQAVLALIDDSEPEDRASRAAAALDVTISRVSQEEALRAMLDDQSAAIRCIAARQIAEMSMQSAVPDLERAVPREKGIVRDTMEQVLRMLSGSGPRGEVGSVA